MNSCPLSIIAWIGCQVSLVSPSFHPLGVKLEKCGKGRKIKEYNNSLFMFHLFTPAPPRDACPRVFARVRVRGGEKVKLENGCRDGCPERETGWLRSRATTCRSSMVPPWPKRLRDGRGNSLAIHDSLFQQSGKTPRGLRGRATGRVVCRRVGLPVRRHGPRPCATWRGRDAPPRTSDIPNGFTNNGNGHGGRSHHARSTGHEG